MELRFLLYERLVLRLTTACGPCLLISQAWHNDYRYNILYKVFVCCIEKLGPGTKSKGEALEQSI